MQRKEENLSCSFRVGGKEVGWPCSAGRTGFCSWGGGQEERVGGCFFSPFQVERNFKMVAEPRRKVVIATKV